MPNEEEVMEYFKYLREDRKLASSSIWTTYSLINSVIKQKYGKCLQDHPRVTALIKSYHGDVKKSKKAVVFTSEEIDQFVTSNHDNAYWLVRKVIVVIAYFGALRHVWNYNWKR